MGRTTVGIEDRIKGELLGGGALAVWQYSAADLRSHAAENGPTPGRQALIAAVVCAVLGLLLGASFGWYQEPPLKGTEYALFVLWCVLGGIALGVVSAFILYLTSPRRPRRIASPTYIGRDSLVFNGEAASWSAEWGRRLVSAKLVPGSPYKLELNIVGKWTIGDTVVATANAGLLVLSVAMLAMGGNDGGAGFAGPSEWTFRIPVPQGREAEASELAGDLAERNALVRVPEAG